MSGACRAIELGIIDGEAMACGDDGIAQFDRIRYRRHDADVFMWAFDLIELSGRGQVGAAVSLQCRHENVRNLAR